MNSTEHRMRLCFDPEYSAKYEELREERRVLVDAIKSYYGQQHPVLWLTILGTLIAFIATRELALIGPLIMPVVMLVVPIGYGLIQYVAKRRKLGL